MAIVTHRGTGRDDALIAATEGLDVAVVAGILRDGGDPDVVRPNILGGTTVLGIAIEACGRHETGDADWTKAMAIARLFIDAGVDPERSVSGTGLSDTARGRCTAAAFAWIQGATSLVETLFERGAAWGPVWRRRDDDDGTLWRTSRQAGHRRLGLVLDLADAVAGVVVRPPDPPMTDAERAWLDAGIVDLPDRDRLVVLAARSAWEPS